MRRLCAYCFLWLLPFPLLAQGAPDAVRIHFFDVGQGDAALIEAPEGQRVLIDAGRGGGIVDHLRGLQVDTIDLLIASHNHADHIGGATAVLREFPVRFFMDNGIEHTTATYRALLETIQALDVPLLDPERRVITLGEVSLEILPPPDDPAWGHNDNSIGAVLRFGEFKAFFGGDAEGRLWRYWVDAFPEALARVQLHKASHHGSRAGDTSEGMDLLRPEIVVVSAGANNPYGHPHPEALRLYAQVGAAVFVTAEDGTVVIAGGRDGRVSVVSGGEVTDSALRRADLESNPALVD